VKGLAPACTATAVFVDGPLRKHISVEGITQALEQNARNNCNRRRSISVVAWEMKRWMLGRLNNGNGAKAGNIKDYSFEKERTANSIEIGLSEEEAEHYDEVERFEEGSGDEEVIESVEIEEQDSDEEVKAEIEVTTDTEENE